MKIDNFSKIYIFRTIDIPKVQSKGTRTVEIMLH